MSQILSVNVRLAAGASTFCDWSSAVNVRFPAFWIELDHRSRVVLQSLAINNEEQLVDPARGTPAIIFALGEVARLTLPSMRFLRDKMRLTFKNPEDASESVFCVWFGEWRDVQDKADELGTGAP